MFDQKTYPALLVQVLANIKKEPVSSNPGSIPNRTNTPMSQSNISLDSVLSDAEEEALVNYEQIHNVNT
jgi:hypothetical protein